MSMRITGFSGMDIDTMVKSLMTAQRAPLDKLNQQKQILEWQRDNYREINSKLFDFRNNKLANYGMSAQMNGYTAAVTGNSDAVKAVASPNANNIPMEISVSQLAEQANFDTKGIGFGYNIRTTLADIQEKTTGKKPAADEEFKLFINGEELSFKNTLSISEVITKINSDPKANATAKFDELTGKLTILSKDYGSESKLILNDDTATNKNSNLLDLFGGGNFNAGTNEFKGTDAQVKINQKDYTFKSNSFTINGIDITLLSTTETVDPNNPSKTIDKPATISTQTDSTKALETLKSFVNDYNNLIDALNKKVDEEKYRNFQPLTEEQRKEMTESDIKLWEEKAKSGLLKSDPLLRSTINEMRMVISANIGQLSSMGITTGKYFEGGKLHLDETKLKQALEKNPQSVMDLFQGPASAPGQGIFDKLQDVMNDTMNDFSEKAGTTKYSGDVNSLFKEESIMGRQLKDYNKRIYDMTQKLNDLENRYYRQFSAMEAAMNKYNSQSSSITSLFNQS